jgi:hypothetical protein
MDGKALPYFSHVIDASLAHTHTHTYVYTHTTIQTLPVISYPSIEEKFKDS